MVVNRSYASYMAQMAVASTSHEFKLGTSTILVEKLHVFNIAKYYKLVSLEIGDKMLCI